MAIGWVVSAASGLAVLYGVYPHNQVSPEDTSLPMSDTIAYNMFQRGVWAASIAWVIVACHWGYGGNDNLVLKLIILKYQIL